MRKGTKFYYDGFELYFVMAVSVNMSEVTTQFATIIWTFCCYMIRIVLTKEAYYFRRAVRAVHDTAILVKQK